MDLCLVPSNCRLIIYTCPKILIRDVLTLPHIRPRNVDRAYSFEVPVFHQLKQLRKAHDVVLGALAHPGIRKNAEMLEKHLMVRVLAPDHSLLISAEGMIRSFSHWESLTLGYFGNTKLQALDLEIARHHLI